MKDAVRLPAVTKTLASTNTLSLPALFVPNPEAGKRLVEFFTANIRNPNIRKAYVWAAVDFDAWCEVNDRESSRTNGLYDRRNDDMSLDEVEWIVI